MTRFLEDEEDAMQNGVLQNGMYLRVPLMMRDGITPNPALTERQRAIAAATRDTATLDASLHRPGYRHATGTNDSTHRPGYRYGVTNDAMENVYADKDRAMSDSWRGNASAGTFNNAPPAGSEPEGTSHEGDNNRRDAQQTMDAIYSEYDLRIQNSWRNQS